MYIESISISGYKSLFDVSVEPGPLTVIAGSNNSGKSNFVEAFDFLSDCFKHDLEMAVNRKGGFHNMAYRGEGEGGPIAFAVVVTLSSGPGGLRKRGYRGRADTALSSLRIEYRFSIDANRESIDSNFVIVEEKVVVDFLTLRNRGGRLFSITRRNGTPRLAWGRAGEVQALRDFWCGPLDDERYRAFLRQGSDTELLMERLSFVEIFRMLKEELSRARSYQLSPLESRLSGVPTPNAEIETHGRNLPGLVAFLRKDELVWQQVMSSMREIEPTLEDIDIGFTHDRRLTLSFVADGGQAWNPAEVSDGTIQALAMFCVLYDRRSAVLFVEEPENSLHPWILRSFLLKCREVAKRKQIFLTSHSPILLSCLEPSELSLIWKESGKTSLRALVEIEPDADRMFEDGVANVFEIVDSGLVQEALPGRVTW